VTETLVPPLQRWLLFSGVLLLVGTVAWRGLIAPRVRYRLAGKDAPPEFSRELPQVATLERRVARAGLLTALLLLGVWGMRLWAQVLEFRDPFAPLSDDLRFLLFDTFWGTVWIVQGALLALLVLGFRVLRLRAGTTPPPPPGVTPEGIPREGHRPVELPPRWKVVAAGVFFLLLTLALSSHAMSVPANRPLAVSVDLVHAAVAGTWIGTLALILTTTPRGRDHVALLGIQLRTFSPVALASVGILLFTGILLSGFHMHEIPALWESRYGRTLSIKLLVVGGVMGLGFRNWRRGLPSLPDPQSLPDQRNPEATGPDPGAPQPAGTPQPALETAAAVRRSAALEVGMAVLVVLVTAVLVATPVPPGAHQ
jgi:putative copper export protein